VDETGDLAPHEQQLLHGSVLLGRFHRYDADPPSAELFEVMADLDSVVDQILTDLAGWNLTTTDEALASALVDRGALPTRHFSLMTIALGAIDIPEGELESTSTLDAYDVRPLDAKTEIPRAVISLVRSAYPAGHPDEELGSDDEIVRDIQNALNGIRLGPLMDASALVFDGDRLVALVLVNRVPGGPPTGGPWITDVCRDPDPQYAGLGRAMLGRVLTVCRARGETSVSLAVTEGNSARWLYESLGFTLVATTRKVRLPG
jgi:ribosomal protein S18 acetylase RimI-like enzyme